MKEDAVHENKYKKGHVSLPKSGFLGLLFGELHVWFGCFLTYI